MGKLDRVEVEHVAGLAKIPLSSKELSTFQGQLGEITEYVGKIGKIPITKHQIPNELKIQNTKLQTGREDKTGTERCLTQEEAVSNAKNKYNGLFAAEAVFGD
mgnify:CR=1 FL=1